VNHRDKRPFAALWDFLCSLKLTIATLILLAATSIIGTVVQQNRSPQEYLQIYSETTFKVLDSLQVFDMYHSWWFLGLLGVFTLNLIACSIKRLPRVWKNVRDPVLAPDDTLYRTLSNFEEVVVRDRDLDQVQERVGSVLGKEFAPPTVTRDGEAVHLFAQKMPWARFGVYVTHLSIIIIFIGAIIGSLWGYKAFVNIVEGTSTDKAYPRGQGEPIDLGFSVRADDFNVSFYEGTGRPKEFMSILDVVDGGKEVVTDRKIVVNDPLTYEGITFYQSSYGPAGEPVFRIRATEKSSGRTMELKAELGAHVELPGGYSFAVTDSAPSYRQFGPAVQMHVNAPDGSHGNPFIVFQDHPEFDARRGGAFSFSVLGWDQLYYTGLQVAKDPGVWVVWTGCLLLMIGTFIAFCLSHRRIWVTLQPVDGEVGVKLGGSAHRNQPAFEIYFDDLKQKIKDQLAS